ncbi:MAG: hypothetical protein IJ863_01770 [Spirochaetales bacterium]|nr:hypothetical protein [Spirochaetales bacterium]
MADIKEIFSDNQVEPDTPLLAWIVDSARSEEELSSFSCLVENIISTEIANTRSGTSSLSIPAKTLSNYRSGFRRFINYLGVENSVVKKCEDIGFPKSEKKIEIPFNSDQFFSHRQMFNTFKSRLKTQDRFYSHIIFPVRLLSKLFNGKGKKEEYNLVLKNTIDSTKILICGEEKDVCFSSVSSLNINIGKENSCQVNVVDKGWKTVCTECYENGGGPKIRLLQPLSFMDLSLDHDTAMHNLLEEHCLDYPALKRLSDRIANHFNISGDYNQLRGYRDRICSEFYESVGFSENEIDNLYKEFVELSEKISLTIMERSENSRKNAS